MHTAFSAQVVLDHLKEKVEAVLIHAGKLFLGSSVGTLTVYRLPTSRAATHQKSRTAASQSSSVAALEQPETDELAEVVETSVGFAKKSIELLGVIKEANVLVSLSDGCVSLHDLITLQPSSFAPAHNSTPPLPLLTQTRTALTFAIDTSVQRRPAPPRSHMSQRGGPFGMLRSGGTTSAGQGHAYRPSATGTLPRTRGSSAADPSWRQSLRGMDDLVREKEERERRVKEGLEEEDGARKSEGPDGGVMTLVTVLAVGCRRKVVLFRWVDGEFYDTKEINLPHSPRSLAFPQPTSLFMGYSPTEYSLLSIPLAAQSSASAAAAGALGGGSIPPSSVAGLRVDTAEWRVKELNFPTLRGASSSDAQQGASAGAGGLGAAFGGLGGYVMAMGSKAKGPVVLQIEGGEVLVGRENMGVFLGSDGKPSRRDGVDWPTTPDDISFARPYLFAALPPGVASSPMAPKTSDASSAALQFAASWASHQPVLQVRSASTLAAVQTLPFPPAPTFDKAPPPVTSMHLHHLTPSPGAKPPLYVITTPTDRTTLEREGSKVWCLQMRGWGKQIDEFVDAGEYEEALALLDSVDEVILEDKHERRALVQSLYGVSLFKNGRYDEAIEAFIELDTNPAKVIALYPPSISGPLAKPQSEWLSLFGGKAEPVTIEEEAPAPAEAEEAAEADNKSIRSVAPTLSSSPGAKSVKSVAPPSGPSVDASPQPVARERSRFTSLLGGRRPQSIMGDPAASATPVASPRKDDDTRSLRSVVSTRDTLRAAAQGQDDTLKSSLDALGTFLADRRRIFKPLLEALPPSATPTRPASLRSQGGQPPPATEAQPGQTLDLTSSTIEQSAGELLALPDGPLPTLQRTQLLAVARVVDTALFKTFLATKPALLGPLCRVENWCEVSQVEELLMERKKFSELIALYGGRKMHAPALALLRKLSEDEDDDEEKVGPTVRYLQGLGAEEIDLITRTAHWVLEVDADAGMEIFTADTGKVADLPRFEVVADLEKFNTDLCIRYLEHIITELGESEPAMHDKLATLYLKTAADTQLGEERLKLLIKTLAFLDASQQYHAERLLGRIPDLPDELRAKTRAKTSAPDGQDTDVSLLSQIRATVLGRMGQHEGALSIYVHKLRDPQKAEAYCKRVWAESQMKTSSGAGEGVVDEGRKDDREVFLTLLKIYLRPRDGGKSQQSAAGAPVPGPLQLEAALGLLSRHAARLDATAVLAMLPPLVRLDDVRAFSLRALQQATATRNQARVLARLRQSRALQVEEALVARQAKRVRVSETRTCPRCQKRLGNSIIAVTSTGAVLHYFCSLDASARTPLPSPSIRR